MSDSRAFGAVHYVRPLSRREQVAVQIAEALQVPFLLYDNGAGGLADPFVLAGDREVTVGTSEGADIQISWDRFVSKTHFSLEPFGGRWFLRDRESTNGTRVNGDPARERRLEHLDVIAIGERTSLQFRDRELVEETPILDPSLRPDDVTNAERRVWAALAMHQRTGVSSAPASDREIANALHVEHSTVRSHIGALYRKLALSGKPNQRRELMLLAVRYRIED